MARSFHTRSESARVKAVEEGWRQYGGISTISIGETSSISEARSIGEARLITEGHQ